MSNKTHVKLKKSHIHDGSIYPHDSVLRVSPKVAKYLEEEGIAEKLSAKEAKGLKVANDGKEPEDDTEDNGGEGGGEAGEGG